MFGWRAVEVELLPTTTVSVDRHPVQRGMEVAELVLGDVIVHRSGRSGDWDSLRLGYSRAVGERRRTAWRQAITIARPAPSTERAT